jgi:hypothetical protein
MLKSVRTRNVVFTLVGRPEAEHMGCERAAGGTPAPAAVPDLTDLVLVDRDDGPFLRTCEATEGVSQLPSGHPSLVERAEER